MSLRCYTRCELDLLRFIAACVGVTRVIRTCYSTNMKRACNVVLVCQLPSALWSISCHRNSLNFCLKKHPYEVHIFQSLSLYATTKLVNVLLLFSRHKFVRPSCWCLWRRFENTKIGCPVTRCLYEIFRGNWPFSVSSICVRNLAKGYKDELIVFSRKEWFLRNPEYWHVTLRAYWPWMLMPACPFILTVMVS